MWKFVPSPPHKYSLKDTVSHNQEKTSVFCSLMTSSLPMMSSQLFVIAIMVCVFCRHRPVVMRSVVYVIHYKCIQKTILLPKETLLFWSRNNQTSGFLLHVSLGFDAAAGGAGGWEGEEVGGKQRRGRGWLVGWLVGWPADWRGHKPAVFVRPGSR